MSTGWNAQFVPLLRRHLIAELWELVLVDNASTKPVTIKQYSVELSAADRSEPKGWDLFTAV